jgi:hypothetical protein
MESYESKNEDIELKRKDKKKYNILLQDLNISSHYIKLPLISPFPTQRKNKGNISLNSHNKSNYSMDLLSINSKQSSNKKSINYSNTYDDEHSTFNTDLLITNPNVFHNKVIRKNERYNIPSSVDLGEINRNIINKSNNNEGHIIKDYLQDLAFDKAYKRKKININIRNILKNEIKDAKNKLHIKDVSKSTKRTKPIILEKFERLKFIKKENPILQLNRKSNVPSLVKDSKIMFKLFSKGLNLKNINDYESKY